jgi:hypothetical protein
MSASPVSSPDTLSAERAFRVGDHVCLIAEHGSDGVVTEIDTSRDDSVVVLFNECGEPEHYHPSELAPHGWPEHDGRIRAALDAMDRARVELGAAIGSTLGAYRKMASPGRALLSERPTLSQADADALIFEFEVQSRKRVGADYERARAALRAALLGEKP